MCNIDDIPGPDIDPEYFKEESPKEAPLENPFYSPIPGEDEWDTFGDP